VGGRCVPFGGDVSTVVDTTTDTGTELPDVDANAEPSVVAESTGADGDSVSNSGGGGGSAAWLLIVLFVSVWRRTKRNFV